MRKIISIGWKFLVLFILFWMFQECMAGVVVEQVVRDREGSPSKALLYFSDYRFRTDHEEGGLTTIHGLQRGSIVDDRSPIQELC